MNKARYKFLGLNLDYLDREGPPGAGLRAAVHDRAGAGRGDGRARAASRRAGARGPSRRRLTSIDSDHRPHPGARTMDHVKGKRVAVLVEKLYEDLELWYPVLRLREAGCDGDDRRPEGGRDVPLEARLPGEGRRGGRRGQGGRLRRDRRSPAATRPTTCAGTRRWSTWSPQADQARQGGGGDLPRPLDALLDEVPEGPEGHRVLRDPRRRRERRRRLGGRRLRPRRQPRHQPDPRRPPRLHERDLRGPGRGPSPG